MVELLILHTWWSWSDGDRSWHSHFVHWFNLFEGTIWCIFGVLVFLRYRKHRHSRIEILYAAAFVVFGLTDFLEAFALTSWLLWVKLLTLISLWRLRRLVRQRWYPNSRLH